MSESKQPGRVSFPLFVIPVDPVFDEQDNFVFDPGSKFVGAMAEDGRKTILVFTDDALAQAYALAMRVPFETIELATLDQAINFMTRAQEVGGFVAFGLDPKFAEPLGGVWSIDEFVSRCRGLFESN